MMRKGMAAVLFIVLTMCLAFSCALADNIDLFSSNEDDNGINGAEYVETMEAVGDTLYILRSDQSGEHLSKLYRWQSGMKEAELVADNVFYLPWTASEEEAKQVAESREKDIGAKIDLDKMITQLFSGGDKLMAFNAVNGKVFEVGAENGKAALTEVTVIKDLSPFQHREDDNVWLANYSSGAVADGYFVCLVQDYNANGRDDRLIRIDLATGEVTLSKQKNVSGLTAYKDGKVLLSFCDPEDEKSRRDDQWVLQLTLWDPAADTVQPLGEVLADNRNLFYSPAMDAVLSLERCRVMGFDSTLEKKQYGYIPFGGARLLTVGDSVVAGEGETVLVRTVSRDYKDDAYLLVSDNWLDQGGRLFASRYPQIPIYPAQNYYDGEGLDKLAQAMSGGDAALDVISLNMAYNRVDTLMRKGYCEDLSGNAEIMAYINRLHPVFKDAVTRDGKVYAVPVQAYSYDGWYAATGVMEEMGLTLEDIPTNFADLCAFLTRWNDEWVDEYPQFAPIEYAENYKAFLLREYILPRYMYSCMSRGEEVRFNTPEFKTLMQALEGMRTDKLEKGVSRENEDEVGYRQALLMPSYGLVGSFSSGRNDAYRKFVPMSLTADTPFLTAVNLQVLFLNPKSTHKEAALNYILCKLETTEKDDYTAHTLYADKTDPVENENLERIMEYEQRYHEELLESLEKAEDADKKEIQSQIDEHAKWMENARTEMRYRIAPESVQFYLEEVVPHIFVGQPTFLTGGKDNEFPDLNTLLERYLAGQIKADQFIRDMDSKMMMMQMEDY